MTYVTHEIEWHVDCLAFDGLTIGLVVGCQKLFRLSNGNGTPSSSYD